MPDYLARDENRPKVLVVDDERVIADTLRTILNHKGFEAASVYSGQGAIDMARVWPPDILLTDVMMPGLDGIEAAIRISRMIPACRVLLFSGDADTPRLQSEAQARGHHFQLLQKPLHPEELLVILGAL